MKVDFKSKYTFQERSAETHRILLKHKDRIPVICQKAPSAGKHCPDIDKQKYLLPFDLTIGQFIYVIRKRMKLDAELALFIFINNMIPSNSTTISSVYDIYKNEDNFLYVYYSLENTFGNN